jgi:hypothetical protein
LADPALTVTYRDEYVHVMGPAEAVGLRVQLLQEFLSEHRAPIEAATRGAAASATKVRLFGHCTERAFLPTTGKVWQAIFAAAGAELRLALSDGRWRQLSMRPWFKAPRRARRLGSRSARRRCRRRLPR